MIKTVVIGAGNCCAALFDGLNYYKSVPDRWGIMSEFVGPYEVTDIELVGVVDVDRDKVGRTLRDVAALMTNYPKTTFGDEDPGPVVTAGVPLDGFGPHYRDRRGDPVTGDVDDVMKLFDGADVVVNFIPVGSEEASRGYALLAAAAGCAFVNCIPTFLNRDPTILERFEEAGVPLIGDDVKSQVGATILHQQIVDIMSRRGARLDRTYQLNFGGNMDFWNMLDRDRLGSKRDSKVRSVTELCNRGDGIADEHVHIAPSDHVAWLGDTKVAIIRCEGAGFAGTPMEFDLRMSVVDSANNAGVTVDAVRCAKLALDRGLAGSVQDVNAWLMKSPAEVWDNDRAHDAYLGFVSDGEQPRRAFG